MIENTRWEKDWAGLWEFIEGETQIACLIPNEEFAGAIVTDIYGPYPELGHASVDCRSVKEGMEFIENWWASVQLYLGRGWIVITADGEYRVSEEGEPHFQAADVPHQSM